MAHLAQFGAILLAFVVCSAKPVIDDVTDVELRMPGVQPHVVDTYLCTPMKMTEDGSYITGFVPHSNMQTAHHMLLFGCEEPGSTDKTWNCGEMESEAYPDQLPVCATEPKIIYAWAMDAPALKLPQGVGFKVGGETSIKWLVLQVHYKNVTNFSGKEAQKDSSGITLHTTSVPQPKTAGVYLLSTGGEIPPHSTTYMEAACSVDEPITIHPFAFRVHAHTHGEVVSGYRVRDGQWTEIGRKSPKEPQMFYNVSTPGITVEKGDILAARCTMVNNEDRGVQIGQTQQDEMCNFYVMYWVSGDVTMDENYCTTAGPPSWYWNKVSTIHVENAPMNASIIPGTPNLLKATKHMMEKVDKMMENSNKVFNEELLELLGEINGQNRVPQLDNDLELEDPLEEDVNELKQLNDLPDMSEYQNEIGGYDPDDFRSTMFGGYQPEVEGDSPYDWFQRYDREEEYSPYEDEDGRLYYPQY